ncbi:ribonuclease P protein component [bacterium]|nr:ribonuclease P protein component [bacterium]MBU1651972.1 ribonuclease P protein component [bacterium]
MGNQSCPSQRKKSTGSYFDAFFLPANEFKFAVLVSKKLGKAHVRNLHKRWAREVFRRQRSELSVPGSVIVSFNRPAESFHQVEEDLVRSYRAAIQGFDVDP